MREQAFSIVAGERYPNRELYKVSLDQSGLNIVYLDGMQWLAVVLYNRGELKEYVGSRLVLSIQAVIENADVLVGLIADDKIPEALGRFSDGFFSDVMLYQALTRVNLGKQWVAMTQKACDACSASRVFPGSEEVSELNKFDEDYRAKGKLVIQQVTREYRRVGVFLDELIDSGFLNTDFSALPSSWSEVVGRYSR